MAIEATPKGRLDHFRDLSYSKGYTKIEFYFGIDIFLQWPAFYFYTFYLMR